MQTAKVKPSTTLFYFTMTFVGTKRVTDFLPSVEGPVREIGVPPTLVIRRSIHIGAISGILLAGFGVWRDVEPTSIVLLVPGVKYSSNYHK